MAGNNLRLTVPEVIALCDRLIARGHSIVMRDQPELQKDLRLAGRVLAHLILTNVITDTIVLENGGR
jgi:hypothetical protein